MMSCGSSRGGNMLFEIIEEIIEIPEEAYKKNEVYRPWPTEEKQEVLHGPFSREQRATTNTYPPTGPAPITSDPGSRVTSIQAWRYRP